MFLIALSVSVFSFASPAEASTSVKSSGFCSNYHSYYSFTLQRSGSTVKGILEVYPANVKAKWGVNISYDAPLLFDKNVVVTSDKKGTLKVSYSVKSSVPVRTIWTANFNNQIFCSVGGML